MGIWDGWYFVDASRSGERVLGSGVPSFCGIQVTWGLRPTPTLLLIVIQKLSGLGRVRRKAQRSPSFSLYHPGLSCYKVTTTVIIPFKASCVV